MTDKEIIKALKCCGSNDPCGEECFGHDMHGTAQCTTILAQNALDRIIKEMVGEGK